MGAIKAIDLVSLLQKDSQVRTEALFLLDPVGLYDRHGFILAKRFLQNAFLVKKEVEKQKDSKNWSSIKIKEKIDEVNQDFLPGILDGMKKATGPIDYLRRLLGEIKEMSVKNLKDKEIRIPVFIIQGKREIVSEPEKTDVEKLFKQSPYFKRFLGDEWGIHGLALFRQKQITTICFYLAKRALRELAKSS